MNPNDLIKNKEEEIGELMEKANKEEKRDIYSGDLVRMDSKLKILQSQLDSLIEMNKVWLDRIDEVNKIFQDPSEEWDASSVNCFVEKLKSEDKNE